MHTSPWLIIGQEGGSELSMKEASQVTPNFSPISTETRR